MQLLCDIVATVLSICLILGFAYFAIDSLMLTPLPFK